MTLEDALGNMGPDGWLNIDGLPGLSVPWTEAFHANGEMNQAALSYEGGNQIACTIYVNGSDILTACRELLGTHYFDSGGVLHRTPELPNRFWGRFFCSRITDARPYGKPTKATAADPDDGSPIGYGPFVSTPYGRISMIFTQPLYKIYSDRQIDDLGRTNTTGTYQEWRRYCTFDYQPAVEILTSPNGYFVWAEGGGYSGSKQPVIGNPLDAQPGILLGKPDMILTQWRVPAHGLFDPDFNPVNIANGVGCVNDAPFLGRPAGTLLLMPPRFEAIQAPFADPADSNVQALSYKVQFPLKVFDTTGARQGSLAVGHNTSMWSDGRFWAIKSANGGNSPLPSYDFNRLFLGNKL